MAGLGHGIMHALAKLLLDFKQLLPHPLADRRAPHREVPFPVLPANVRSSRPAELHRQPLTEPSVRLSPHSAPIRQTRQSSRSANVQRYPRIPSPAVLGTDSLGLCGV